MALNDFDDHLERVHGVRDRVEHAIGFFGRGGVGRVDRPWPEWAAASPVGDKARGRK